MVQTLLNFAKVILGTFLIYVGFLSFSKYLSSQSQAERPVYEEYQLNLKPEWYSSEQVMDSEEAKKFELIGSESLEIQKGKQAVSISYDELGISHEDALYIKSITTVGGKNSFLTIKSDFFNFVYSEEKKSLCYQRFHQAERKEYYFGVNNELWVFTHPKNDILILRVFSCSSQELKFQSKFIPSERILSLSSIQESSQGIEVKALTFSKNKIVYVFDTGYEMVSNLQEITHDITRIQRTIPELKANLLSETKTQKFYEMVESLLFQLSQGTIGQRVQPHSRQIQQQFGIEALDTINNLILELNKTKNEFSVVRLNDVLLPFRTPVFMSKQNYNKMKPIDQALNSTKSDSEEDLIDFQVYEIRDKSILEVRKKLGVYQITPDSSVHFMSFDSKLLSFYPNENLNKDEYYGVRNLQGQIIFKGNQIKGMISEYPLPKEHSISMGFSKSEVYHQMTTHAKELMPGIYEAHIVHKGLFTYFKKNRIDFVSTASGKPVLTYYFRKGYQYSSSFIENNEIWVFEHSALEPLVTKYELYVNASAPKTVLNIKREYLLGIQGKITRVQKCIDGYYYFDYVHKGKYGVVRQHHALMSNRQPHPLGKQSGVFEKSMILKNIERNKKLRISGAEEKLFSIEMQIDPKVVENWTELSLKHQYSVLPYRVYLNSNTYYVFDIRKLLIQSYDQQISKIEAQVNLMNAAAGLAFGVLCLALLRTQKEEAKQGEAKKKSE